MMIFDSAQDIHVVIKTPNALLLDTVACAVDLEDQLGRFTIEGGDAALAALVPSEIVVRRRDGSEARIDITWGSLTAVGNQVRIVVRSGEVREVEALPIAV
jgi:F0F1-type ATP synthase epsilon subunit